MTFGRAIFLLAFLMLGIGMLSSRWVVSTLFAQPPEPSSAAIGGAVATHTPLPRPSVTATRVPTVVETPLPHATSAVQVKVPHRKTKVHAAPTSTPRPRPSSTPGTVTLARYWVGTVQTRPGQTISVGYIIDNETGRTARVGLGASIKPARVLSWAGGAISDPPHDVVAIVPPGVSTHVRFFSLPAGLRSGAYDVAWGLRDANTGQRDALVAASASLRVRG